MKHHIVLGEKLNETYEEKVVKLLSAILEAQMTSIETLSEIKESIDEWLEVIVKKM